jgi:stage V sporulation protein G
MRITSIRIHCLKETKGKLLGFAEIVFDEQLVVKDIKILKSSHGPFIGMPSRQLPDGSWREIVFSINSELEAEIKLKVLRAYDDELNRPESMLM